MQYFLEVIIEPTKHIYYVSHNDNGCKFTSYFAEAFIFSDINECKRVQGLIIKMTGYDVKLQIVDESEV